MDNLKPCPFCGKEAEPIQELLMLRRAYIICSDHDCWGHMKVEWGTMDDKDKFIKRLIDNWNRRAEPKEADFDCEHCKHLKPSNKTNRLFCSYHSEGEHQYEVFKDEYCSYFERAESSREG